MKTKKNRLVYADLKKLTDEELAAEITGMRGTHFTLRSQSVTEKVEDHSQFREVKRSIARLLTEQTARRKQAGAK
ncbi:MAG: 50S ribosomal protein L29 [Phycisphaerales bacterium]|nr:50S ribosomal protein L29 [Phycisphaerales bacterium]